MATVPGLPVLMGERVIWFGNETNMIPLGGQVKWIGKLIEMGRDWTIGVEFDDPVPRGMNGIWGNRRLFSAKPNCGLLVPVTALMKESDFQRMAITAPEAAKMNSASWATAVNRVWRNILCAPIIRGKLYIRGADNGGAEYAPPHSIHYGPACTVRLGCFRLCNRKQSCRELNEFRALVERMARAA